MRAKYWSDSKLARWIRNYHRPDWATLDEWDDWHESAKKENPVRYWIAEVAMNKLQDIANWPKDTIWGIRCYLVNRWVDRTHYLRTGLKSGQWHEFDTRMLHGMFTELVDYVEVECALFATSGWGDKHGHSKAPAKWHRWIRTWRSSEIGVQYFRDQLAEDKSFQYHSGLSPAQIAKEVLEIYFWWTCHRPHRPEHLDASGWTAYNNWRTENKVSLDEYRAPYTQARVHAILDLSTKIEQQYEEEDTNMMIRLVKLRKYLWT